MVTMGYGRTQRTQRTLAVSRNKSLRARLVSPGIEAVVMMVVLVLLVIMAVVLVVAAAAATGFSYSLLSAAGRMGRI